MPDPAGQVSVLLAIVTPVSTPSTSARIVPPVVFSVNPAGAIPPGAAITVTGLNFVPPSGGAAGSVVVLNGVTVTTYYVSPTELTASATTSYTGNVPLTVNNYLATAPDSPVYATGSSQDLKIYTPVPSATVGLGGNPIVAMYPVPNPNPSCLWVQLRQPVDSLELKVYSRSLVVVGTTTTPPQEPGLVKVALPAELGASGGNGLYFYKVIASRNGNTIDGPVGGKFYIFSK